MLRSYEVTHGTVMRFTVTAAVVNQNITFQNLGDTIAVATTAIAPFQLFQQVKLLRVSVWGILAQGASSTVEVLYPANNNPGLTGNSEIVTDTSLGVRPACVHAVPGRKTQAGDWQLSTSAAIAFKFTAPTGSVIDVAMTFRNIPGTATACTNASVGATVGSVFYRGLDGLAVAATNLPPPVGILTF
jgi:hypothetical protein